MEFILQVWNSNLYIHSITVDMMKIEDLYMYPLLTYYLCYSIWTKDHFHIYSHKSFIPWNWFKTNIAIINNMISRVINCTLWKWAVNSIAKNAFVALPHALSQHIITTGESHQSWIFEAEYWNFNYGYKSLEAPKLWSVI